MPTPAITVPYQDLRDLIARSRGQMVNSISLAEIADRVTLHYLVSQRKGFSSFTIVHLEVTVGQLRVTTVSTSSETR